MPVRASHPAYVLPGGRPDDADAGYDVHRVPATGAGTGRGAPQPVSTGRAESETHSDQLPG